MIARSVNLVIPLSAILLLVLWGTRVFLFLSMSFVFTAT